MVNDRGSERCPRCGDALVPMVYSDDLHQDGDWYNFEYEQCERCGFKTEERCHHGGEYAGAPDNYHGDPYVARRRD